MHTSKFASKQNCYSYKIHVTKIQLIFFLKISSNLPFIFGVLVLMTKS